MKSCPTCNRTYPDDNLAFCLMDGSVLSAPYDPAETRATPLPLSEPPPTELIGAPTKPAETRAPLQSTIRAPVPQVPDLYARLVAHPPERTIAVPLLFRLPLATRGILAAVCIFPFIFASGGWQPWYVWYPLLGGALSAVAGVSLYARNKTGWLLMIEGIFAVLAGTAMLMASRWGYWQGSWPIVSGALTIAAAWELRKHITQTWVLAVAGVFFAIYAVQWWAHYFYLAAYFRNLYLVSPHLYRFRYLAGVVLLSGIALTAFSFLTRGRDLIDSN